MASKSAEFAEYVVDALRPLGEVSSSRFFGGQQIRVNGEQLAMVMKGELYFRVERGLQLELETAGGRPFSYSTRRGKVTVRRYFAAPSEWIENTAALLDFAQRALAALQS
jgi:DNA transformation protein and related proteins